MGSSVILDGVVDDAADRRCREVASEERATYALILTECADEEIHRARIEGRYRLIPNWYELDWDHVERTRNLRKWILSYRRLTVCSPTRFA